MVVIEEMCSVARERQVGQDPPSESGTGAGPSEPARVASRRTQLLVRASANCCVAGAPDNLVALPERFRRRRVGSRPGGGRPQGLKC